VLAGRSRKKSRPGKQRSARAGVKPAAGPNAARAASSAGPTADQPKSDKPAHPASIGGWKVEPPMSRSQRRDAEVRAGLVPIGAGERPGAIVAGTIISGLIGLGQLIAFFAGLKIHGKSPAAVGTIGFCVLMIICAAGMWRLWYGAVLGFMALLAIVATLFSLYLIEASNVLGLVIALAVVGGSGYLFFKLVRVLSRIQMPRYPGR
jgi:hypothetical protein